MTQCCARDRAHLGILAVPARAAKNSCLLAAASREENGYVLAFRFDPNSGDVHTLMPDFFFVQECKEGYANDLVNLENGAAGA